MEFHTKGKTHNITKRYAPPIYHLRNYVPVTRADFVEKRDTAAHVAAFLWNLPCDVLSYCYIHTYTSGEQFIVSLGISAGLLLPKFVAKDSVKIETGRKWLYTPSVLHANTPGQVVFLQCHGNLGAVALMFGYKAKHEFSFPLLPPTVVPTNAARKRTHVAGILKHKECRNKCTPIFSIAIDAPVISRG